MLVKDKIPINAPLLTCEVGETVHRFLPCGKCGAVWNEKCKLVPKGIGRNNYANLNSQDDGHLPTETSRGNPLAYNELEPEYR